MCGYVTFYDVRSSLTNSGLEITFLDFELLYFMVYLINVFCWQPANVKKDVELLHLILLV